MKFYIEPKLEINKIVSLEEINNQNSVDNWMDSEGMDVDAFTTFDASSM